MSINGIGDQANMFVQKNNEMETQRGQEGRREAFQRDPKGRHQGNNWGAGSDQGPKGGFGQQQGGASAGAAMSARQEKLSELMGDPFAPVQGAAGAAGLMAGEMADSRGTILPGGALVLAERPALSPEVDPLRAAEVGATLTGQPVAATNAAAAPVAAAPVEAGRGADAAQRAEALMTQLQPHIDRALAGPRSSGQAISVALPLDAAAYGMEGVRITLSGVGAAAMIEVSLQGVQAAQIQGLGAAAQALADRLQAKFPKRACRIVEGGEAPKQEAASGQAALSALFGGPQTVGDDR
ncbi:MAG: hypothetical protein AAFN17_01160 [Pseudomonadota bacterium]